MTNRQIENLINTLNGYPTGFLKGRRNLEKKISVTTWVLDSRAGNGSISLEDAVLKGRLLYAWNRACGVSA